MNSMISKLRSPRKPRIYLSFIAAAALIASLIMGCETNVQPPPTVVSPPNQETIAATPTDTGPDRSIVLVPAGNYTIGSDDTEATQPVHQISLSAFQIDRCEATNVQYAEFLNSLNIQPLQDAASGEVRPSDLPEEAIPLLIEGSEGSQQQPLIALDDEHTPKYRRRWLKVQMDKVELGVFTPFVSNPRKPLCHYN